MMQMEFLLYDAYVNLLCPLLHGVGAVAIHNGWCGVICGEIAWGLPILWHSEEKGIWRDLYGFLQDYFLHVSHWR